MSKYYYRISGCEFEDNVYLDSNPKFTESEILSLDNIFHKLVDRYKIIKGLRYVEVYKVIGDRILEFNIFKGEDEWYYIYLEKKDKNLNIYYKCDQLDGLVRFINDMLI